MYRSLLITALAALLVAGSYEIFLRLVDLHAYNGQDQYATNNIRLENYVDGKTRVVGVIVGSSLTARVPPDALPPSWQLLSQSGENALVGLEVIARTARLPERVLIEVNTLDADYNVEAAEQAAGRKGRILRRILWLTRTANRPANLLVWSRRTVSGPVQEEAGPGFPTLLARQEVAYAGQPEASLAKNLRRMKAIVEGLMRAGVAVAFFEMPVDHALVQTPRARAIRDAVLRIFPARSTCWLLIDDGRSWRTIDGVHLLAQDARVAAKAIVSAPCAGPGRTP